MDTTKTGWPIPTTIKDSFVEFCAHVDSHAQADCAGALFLWQYMPPQIREWAKLQAKGAPIVDLDFWKGLGAGLEVSIRALLETQQDKQESKPKAKR